jgi:hypothetical protein
VDAISSRPSSRLGGVNTAGMNKLEARKMQMLVSQRKKLEWELLVLEDEILNAVRMGFESVPSWTDPNQRRGNRCPKPGSKKIRGCDPDFNLMEGSRMMHEDRTGFRDDRLTLLPEGVCDCVDDDADDRRKRCARDEGKVQADSGGQERERRIRFLLIGLLRVPNTTRSEPFRCNWLSLT